MVAGAVAALLRFGAFAASANFAVDREVPVPAFGQGLGGCAKSETEKSKLSELRDRGAVADYFCTAMMVRQRRVA